MTRKRKDFEILILFGVVLLVDCIAYIAKDWFVTLLAIITTILMVIIVIADIYLILQEKKKQRG